MSLLLASSAKTATTVSQLCPTRPQQAGRSQQCPLLINTGTKAAWNSPSHCDNSRKALAEEIKPWQITQGACREPALGSGPCLTSAHKLRAQTVTRMRSFTIFCFSEAAAFPAAHVICSQPLLRGSVMRRVELQNVELTLTHCHSSQVLKAEKQDSNQEGNALISCRPEDYFV